MINTRVLIIIIVEPIANINFYFVIVIILYHINKAVIELVILVTEILKTLIVVLNTIYHYFFASKIAY